MHALKLLSRPKSQCGSTETSALGDFGMITTQPPSHHSLAHCLVEGLCFLSPTFLNTLLVLNNSPAQLHHHKRANVLVQFQAGNVVPAQHLGSSSGQFSLRPPNTEASALLPLASIRLQGYLLFCFSSFSTKIFIWF